MRAPRPERREDRETPRPRDRLGRDLHQRLPVRLRLARVAGGRRWWGLRSGLGPRVHRVAGRRLRVCRVVGVEAIAWEDVSILPVL